MRFSNRGGDSEVATALRAAGLYRDSRGSRGGGGKEDSRGSDRRLSDQAGRIELINPNKSHARDHLSVGEREISGEKRKRVLARNPNQDG